MVFRLLILSLLLVQFGCSPAKQGARTLDVTSMAVTGNAFPGGVQVRLNNPTTASIVIIDLTVAPFVVNIPDGTWNLHVVAYAGPSINQGIAACGGIENLVLTGLTPTVTLTAAPANCGVSPYLGMIALKPAKWNQAYWDNSKWAP
jgi:hypothetical protein